MKNLGCHVVPTSSQKKNKKILKIARGAIAPPTTNVAPPLQHGNMLTICGRTSVVLKIQLGALSMY
jgi:hypothetical protein